MSGDRQHFLPRFLLKGFASRTEDNQSYTWVFRREKPPFETNLINVGVSTDFYNVEGNRELDDVITKMEGRFANSLEELRSQRAETRLVDTDLPELVTHLILRTKYLRDALQQSTKYLFNALLTALESPEMVEKMMLNYIKTHPNEFLKKVREPFKGYHFSRRQRLRMISNATPAVIREAFPQFMALVELLKKYIRDNFSKLAKDSHVKALRNNPVPGARVDFVRALKWYLVINETGSFILGDVAVVFKTQQGALKPLPDLSDTVLETWLPISTTHLLIGTADTREIDRDVERLNTGTALLSHEFFISSRNSGREAKLAGLLGAKAGLLPEDEMEKIILDLMSQMSGVSS